MTNKYVYDYMIIFLLDIILYNFPLFLVKLYEQIKKTIKTKYIILCKTTEGTQPRILL